MTYSRNNDQKCNIDIQLSKASNEGKHSKHNTGNYFCLLLMLKVSNKPLNYVNKEVL